MPGQRTRAAYVLALTPLFVRLHPVSLAALRDTATDLGGQHRQPLSRLCRAGSGPAIGEGTPLPGYERGAGSPRLFGSHRSLMFHVKRGRSLTLDSGEGRIGG